jgi:hypothetical protein
MVGGVRWKFEGEITRLLFRGSGGASEIDGISKPCSFCFENIPHFPSKCPKWLTKVRCLNSADYLLAFLTSLIFYCFNIYQLPLHLTQLQSSYPSFSSRSLQQPPTNI